MILAIATTTVEIELATVLVMFDSEDSLVGAAVDDDGGSSSPSTLGASDSFTAT